MANSCTVVSNDAHNNGHGSQLAMFSSSAAKDVHPWESPQRKLHVGEICIIRRVEIITNRPMLLFSVAVQLVSTCAKPL